MTLLPGDVIATGTPAGVGMGMSPSQFLKNGDKVELGIEGIGVIEQGVISYWVIGLLVGGGFCLGSEFLSEFPHLSFSNLYFQIN